MFCCGEKTSPFNKRGSKTTFWNEDDPNHTYLSEAIYVSIPFLISIRPGAHYGIFWDNTHRTQFNLGQVADERHYILESDAGEVDYYFFAGRLGARRGARLRAIDRKDVDAAAMGAWLSAVPLELYER